MRFPLSFLLLIPALDAAAQEVVRIAEVRGEVTVHHGDAAQPVAAQVDAPLTTGDRIVVGKNGRADIRVDDAHVFRASSGTELRMVRSESPWHQMELVKGSLTHKLEGVARVGLDLDTPHVSVSIREPGTYRISVNDKGESELSALSGDLHVFAATGSQWIHPGMKMTVRGSSASPEFRIRRSLQLWSHLVAMMQNMQVSAGGSAGDSGDSSDSQSSNSSSRQSHDSGSKTSMASKAETSPASGHAPSANSDRASASSRGK